MNKLIKKIVFILFLMSFINLGFAQTKTTNKIKKIVYVTRLEFRDRDIDDVIKKHLEKLGYQVQLIDQEDPISKVSGADLLIISSVVRSQGLEGKYTNTNIPMLTWENDLLDDHRFTGKNKGIDFGEIEKEHYIWLVNAPHPLSAGLPAGINSVYRKDQPMGWGKPGLGANIIATIPGQTDKAIIFGYEKGATMDYDFIAPARRVFLFLDNRTFPELKENGVKLFDAAVRWALND